MQSHLEGQRTGTTNRELMGPSAIRFVPYCPMGPPLLKLSSSGTSDTQAPLGGPADRAPPSLGRSTNQAPLP